MRATSSLFLLLRLLTYVGLFRQNCLILSEVVLYMEMSKNYEKNHVITVQKKFTFLRRFDHKKHSFCSIKKSNRQVCFQMTLNSRKSCADSFLKIKIDDNQVRFSRNQQNSEKFDSETKKLQSVILTEKRRDIVGVHQRAADYLQRL